MKTTTRNKKVKPLSANAQKQKRFRERQKALGKKLVRGYISPVAMRCYKEISEVTHWSDNDVVSNSLRVTYAAYKCGQIGLLTKWLKDHDLDDSNNPDETAE